MSSLAKARRPLMFRPPAVAAVVLSLLTVFLIEAQPAAAHGSAIEPPSRHYGCARRWDTDFQNPVMRTQDPMCWQAWQANPAAMWTWNGLIQDDPILNGLSYSFRIDAPGRTGRHIVYAVWRAGHADQNYYMCSDVRFPGGAADPTTPPPPPPAENDGRSATYTLGSQWTGGFQADVRVTAGTAAITGWTLTMRFPNGQTVGQAWNATVASDGTTVTARNVAYNGSLAPGAGTSFGVLGSWLETNDAPTITCTATI